MNRTVKPDGTREISLLQTLVNIRYLERAFRSAQNPLCEITVPTMAREQTAIEPRTMSNVGSNAVSQPPSQPFFLRNPPPPSFSLRFSALRLSGRSAQKKEGSPGCRLHNRRPTPAGQPLDPKAGWTLDSLVKNPIARNPARSDQRGLTKKSCPAGR